jgi:NAD(P)-dependent dehydrogenase (short-subunit alcohol dehydrogenase family)
VIHAAAGAPSPDGALEEGPNPTGRAARPEEVVVFVTFLLSDEAALISRAALAIDGDATAQ